MKVLKIVSPTEQEDLEYKALAELAKLDQIDKARLISVRRAARAGFYTEELSKKPRTTPAS